MEGHDDGTMTQSEFAAAQGLSQARVSQLKAEGRLVLTDDGKRLRVAESLARIQATADPTRAGRVARRAAQRAHSASSVASASPAAAADPGASQTHADAATQPSGKPADFILDHDYQGRRARALALQEEAKARQADREEQLALGRLLDADDVVRVLADAGTTFRHALENLGPAIAPMLAACGDESRIVVMLAEAHEQVLTDLARKFAQIGATPA